MCRHELEGVVAKRLSGRYLPGQSGWIKTKNREYWRYEMEGEGGRTVKRAPVRVKQLGRKGRYAWLLEVLAKAGTANKLGLWEACPHTPYNPYEGVKTRR